MDARTHSIAMDRALRTRRHRESRSQPLAGLYVLVVDDHDQAREFYRIAMAYYGAVVITAPTSRSALDTLQRHPADVVLADVMLGGPEDGMWLLREAHRRWPWLPFIVISGADVTADVLTNSGFIAYLRKPVPSELLIDSVLAAIARPAEPRGVFGL